MLIEISNPIEDVNKRKCEKVKIVSTSVEDHMDAYNTAMNAYLNK